MTEGMAGHGEYDRHSEAQARDAASHADLVREAAERVVPDAARGCVVVADYGCGQGRVSDALVRVAVRGIRARHADVPLLVCHNDVLENDWATLFDRLRRPDSYLAEPGGPITPLVSATSFYEPVTPSGVVDLGLSFAALQWLAAPGPAGGGSALYFDQLTGDARDAMAGQAHADWTRLLDRRADELAPGGRMVVDMMGVDDQGHAAGHDAWRLVRTVVEELAAEGRVDRGRLDAYVFPVYERSRDEARRPFDESPGRRLRLEHLALSDSPHPAVTQYRRDGDATAFAHAFVGFFRAFSEPSLRAGLGLDADTADTLYARLEDRLRAAAPDFDFTVHLLTAVIARV